MFSKFSFEGPQKQNCTAGLNATWQKEETSDPSVGSEAGLKKGKLLQDIPKSGLTAGKMSV